MFVDQEDPGCVEDEDYDPARDPVVIDYLAQQAAQREVDAAMKLAAELAAEKEALEYMREVAEAAALERAIPTGEDNDPSAITFEGGPVETHRNKSGDAREVRGQQKQT